MIVQAFERGENPAVYVRTIRTYDGNAARWPRWRAVATSNRCRPCGRSSTVSRCCSHIS